ncbi:hypothetical protein GCM10009681_43300 [Luedemannella helvata]|uniref:Uncharacterized protein n=1 Tax=Luedemannella helvata TaxID=349315 RepID=A0ABP4X4G8_9ACTN
MRGIGPDVATYLGARALERELVDHVEDDIRQRRHRRVAPNRRRRSSTDQPLTC